MHKMLKNIPLYITSIILITFCSCSEEIKVLPEDTLGLQYYPIEIGNYRTYQVDSTIIANQGAFRESSSSYVKEEIVNVIISETGDSTYIIKRSESETLAGPFVAKDVWTVSKTLENVTRNEENLSFIKMLFPIRVGDKWEGNLFDQLTEVNVANQNLLVYLEWESEVLSDFGTLPEFPAMSNIVHIQHADYDNDIHKRSAQEWYAPNVGLVKATTVVYYTQRVGASWEEKVESGFTINKLLVDYN